MAPIGERRVCDQPLCTTLSVMLGFGPVTFSQVPRTGGHEIMVKWDYSYDGIEATVIGFGVNEREAELAAVDQKPDHPVVPDPVLAKDTIMESVRAMYE